MFGDSGLVCPPKSIPNSPHCTARQGKHNTIHLKFASSCICLRELPLWIQLRHTTVSAVAKRCKRACARISIHVCTGSDTCHCPRGYALMLHLGLLTNVACPGSALCWILSEGSQRHRSSLLWRGTPPPPVAKDLHTEATSQTSLHRAASSVRLHDIVWGDCQLAVLAHRQLGKPLCAACWMQLVGIANRFIEIAAQLPHCPRSVGCLCDGSVWCCVPHGLSASQPRRTVPIAWCPAALWSSFQQFSAFQLFSSLLGAVFTA